ncbi:hypothetical protein [Methanosarcina siciliae]|uniref:hypothetical protein n=1 Tax=Methanosarcina siciliae TaxID=38027 RepID=UPI00064F5FC8|nr:hypothetical protein [Methanosarcina siciliae]
MREAVYERLCGRKSVHRWADLSYADQVKTCAGTVGTDVQQQPKNEINSKYSLAIDFILASSDAITND